MFPLYLPRFSMLPAWFVSRFGLLAIDWTWQLLWHGLNSLSHAPATESCLCSAAGLLQLQFRWWFPAPEPAKAAASQHPWQIWEGQSGSRGLGNECHPLVRCWVVCELLMQSSRCPWVERSFATTWGLCDTCYPVGRCCIALLGLPGFEQPGQWWCPERAAGKVHKESQQKRHEGGWSHR